MVDYYGVSAQLNVALAAYTSSDGLLRRPTSTAALRPLTAEIEKLEPQRERSPPDYSCSGALNPPPTEPGIETCVQLLADERLRAEFDVALRMLLNTFDTVLPRPAGAALHRRRQPSSAEIQMQRPMPLPRHPRRRLRPPQIPRRRSAGCWTVTSPRWTSAAKSNPCASPLPDFAEQHQRASARHRAKASEMEHAMRFHIREHLDEDPVHYQKLSRRIDEILDRLKERWEQIALEFQELIDEVRAGRTDADQTGLDPATELPFHSLMAERVANSEPDTTDRLIGLTRGLVADIRKMISVVSFWDNATKQDDLRKAVKRALDDSTLFSFDSLDELAVELVALAKANQHRLR